ncbi:hypothetical protein H0H87_001639 [Tephrocybe sp. NHM501043]|nr:hypothetical protein H0H87_001639 [Tephrocybe sp. NHM501043]
MDTGLFSATVTASIIESYKPLRVETSDAAKDLLAQILAVQIVGIYLNTTVIPPPTSVPNTSEFRGIPDTFQASGVLLSNYFRQVLP